LRGSTILEAIAFCVDFDDLCPMNESVDEGDDAGGVV
jgi:hypothetical protein